MLINLIGYDGADMWIAADQIKAVLPPDPGCAGNARVITAGDSLEYLVLDTVDGVVERVNDAQPVERVAALLLDLALIPGLLDIAEAVVKQLIADAPKVKP
jgi:hypothetical protein